MARKQAYIVAFETSVGPDMRRVMAVSSWSAFEAIKAQEQDMYPSHPEWWPIRLIIAIPASIVTNPEYTIR